jgi:hypothetical protein
MELEQPKERKIKIMMMNKITEKISQEELKEVIIYAFKKGELWGATYQGWFSPTEEERREKMDNAIFFIFNKLGIKLQ